MRRPKHTFLGFSAETLFYASTLGIGLDVLLAGLTSDPGWLAPAACFLLSAFCFHALDREEQK
jgi:hypothetical protein